MSDKLEPLRVPAELLDLSDLLDAIAAGKPLERSAELKAQASLVAEQKDKNLNEDLDEWAARLAKNMSKMTDISTYTERPAVYEREKHQRQSPPWSAHEWEDIWGSEGASS